MKRIILLFTFLFSTNIYFFGQNLIISDDSLYQGVTNNALMEIYSSQNNKGILIPRLTSSQRIAINTGSSEEGLTVYDTDTKSFWIWDGTQWTELSDKQTLSISGNNLTIENGNTVDITSSINSTAWSLNGNSISNGQFIGTLNNQDFIIKTSGTERMRITPQGNIGIGTIQPNYKMEIVEDSAKFAMRIFNTRDINANGLLIESNGGDQDDTLFMIVGDLNMSGNDTNYNFIVLGNGRTGIGHINPNPQTKLDVNGYMIGNVFFAQAYSDDEVTIPGDGNVSFSEVYDTSNSYDGTYFTAPVSGFYFVTTNLTFYGGDGNDDSYQVSFRINDSNNVNTLWTDPRQVSTSEIEYNLTNTAIIRLNAGDRVSVYISHVDTPNIVSYKYRSFTVYFVSK